MQRPAILVVEDEQIVALHMQALLHQLGYHVPAVVTSGQDAVTAAISLQPDLILMDIQLPGTFDGIAATEYIRALLDIPIIYLTSYADAETRQRVRQTAPYGYLVKPVIAATLQTTIEIALERHERDRQVRAREQGLAATLRHISDAVVTVDALGQVTLMNPAAERLLGYTLASARGKLISDILDLTDPQTHPPQTHPVLAALQHGNPAPTPAELLLTNADGSQQRVVASIAVNTLTPASVQGAVVVLHAYVPHEGAGQASAEPLAQQPRTFERMAQLAASVAHDLNSLLTTIIGNAELARLDIPAGHSAHDALTPIELAARQAAGLTRQLLSYAEQIRQPQSLNLLVQEVLQPLRGTVLKPHTISAELLPNLPMVNVDATQIRQVIQNLLINAGEAINTPGGTITVATAAHDATYTQPTTAASSSQFTTGSYVTLSVQDTGTGMNAATLAQIFTPSFTTKPDGHGLGLATVEAIVRGHQGVVTVKSALGHGSAFTVWLPVAV